MKKFSLILACVGIISTAMFANNDFSTNDQGGKPSKSQTIKKQKPVKKAIAMKVKPIKDPKVDQKK